MYLYTAVFLAELHAHAGASLTTKFRKKKWCSLSKAGLSIFAASMCVFKFFFGGGRWGGVISVSYPIRMCLGHFSENLRWLSKLLDVRPAWFYEGTTVNVLVQGIKLKVVNMCTEAVHENSMWTLMFRPFRWCGLFPGVFLLPVVIFLDSSMYFPFRGCRYMAEIPWIVVNPLNGVGFCCCPPTCFGFLSCKQNGFQGPSAFPQHEQQKVTSRSFQLQCHH